MATPFTHWEFQDLEQAALMQPYILHYFGAETVQSCWAAGLWGRLLGRRKVGTRGLPWPSPGYMRYTPNLTEWPFACSKSRMPCDL